MLMRASQKFCILAVLLAFSALQSAAASQRPLILGISHIALFASNPAAAGHFYSAVLGAVKASDPENPQGARYAFSPSQFVEILPLPRKLAPDSGVIVYLDHTAWRTSDASTMRKYLLAKGWKTPAHLSSGIDGSLWFTVLDPEGNKVQFVQSPRNSHPISAPDAVGHHIIHFGFLVHSRDAEDAFYRDLLGFRPYWAGGKKPGEIDYISQQVPDGHDWLEYMLAGAPGTGIPAAVTQRRLGSMDHFSIGEVSVPDEYRLLLSQNRLDCRHDPVPRIGPGDGKYQFNLYDPDGTRIELMNFHPTNTPNPPFTAPDPTE